MSKIQYNINVYGDVIGFDGFFEIQIASSGWSLWPLKKSEIKINADNKLAYAA